MARTRLAVLFSAFAVLAVAPAANAADGDRDETASTIEVIALAERPGFDEALACYDAVEVAGYDAAVDSAFELTKQGDARLRRMAVKILGLMQGDHARAALSVVLCGNPDEGARREAASALARMGDPESIFLLALAADLEADHEVRDAILAGLDRLYLREEAVASVRAVVLGGQRRLR